MCRSPSSDYSSGFRENSILHLTPTVEIPSLGLSATMLITVVCHSSLEHCKLYCC